MIELERFDPMDHNPLQYDGMMVPRADGEWVRAADVDALLARIRAAVEAERRETAEDTIGFTRGTGGSLARVYAARAALDALMADGGA